jgi:hypothetical protein
LYILFILKALKEKSAKSMFVMGNGPGCCFMVKKQKKEGGKRRQELVEE